MESATKYLKKAVSESKKDLHSTLCLIHGASISLGSGLILATGMAPSVRRTVSKLEEAMRKIDRLDLFDRYLSLYGMPATIDMAEHLCEQLGEGYKEIWGYFKEKSVGPPYMRQQPSSESFFTNRIKPLCQYDKRDLVWIVFNEFLFVLTSIFRTIGIENFPERVFEQSRNFTGQPALWVKRYHRTLELIPENQVLTLLTTAEELDDEFRTLATEKYLR